MICHQNDGYYVTSTFLQYQKYILYKEYEKFRIIQDNEYESDFDRQLKGLLNVSPLFKRKKTR
jgi:hypothetical protein